MAKAMSFFGLGVGALLALAFGADLAVGIPFGRASVPMDVGFLLAGLMVAYLGWNASRTAG